MRIIVCLAMMARLLLAAPASAQEAPRAVLDRAIKAHGGEEKLSRMRADKVKLRGTLLVGTREAPFTAETTVQLPNQFKSSMQVAVDNRTFTVLQILNGDHAYIAIDGQPQKIEPAALAEMKETLRLDRAIRLVPLMNDRSFELESLPETKVRDRRAVGIRVSAQGRKELRMYFDRETGLLIKTEHQHGEKSGKTVLQEEYYSDFRDLGGYRRPVKVTAYRDGSKIMEALVTEVKYYERIDETEFAKP